MSVTSVKSGSSLVIQFKQGVNKKGENIIKAQKFSNVKPAASDQDIYDVARAFETLMVEPLVEIFRNDENSLAE